MLQGRYKALNVDGGDENHFQIVGTYIHLNPVRAGLIRPGEQRLSTYRWSSYPSILARPGKRPDWLAVENTLASVGVNRDDASGRRGYEACMEARALECARKRSREELEKDWQRIRRGWYLGDKSFKERLLAILGRDGTKDRKPESVTGGAAIARDEAEAEAWIKAALAELELSEEELPNRPKGAGIKLALAWKLRRDTPHTREWIARRLHMGHVTRVTLATREVGRAKRGELASLRKRVDGVPAGARNR